MASFLGIGYDGFIFDWENGFWPETITQKFLKYSIQLPGLRGTSREVLSPGQVEFYQGI